MDSITQAALGALCGEIILSKKLGVKGAAWGLFFGTLPDLDIIAYLWLDSVGQVAWHRGISHSIFLTPVAALFFAWILNKIHQTKKIKYKTWFWFVWITLITHILIDCFNSYGTQIFEPFSDHRFAFDNMFVIDPFFTGPMLLGLVACIWFFRKREKLRPLCQWLTVSWLCIYFVASLALKVVADRHFAGAFNGWGVTPKAVMSSPTPLNIFAWRGIARDDEKYYVAYWSLFDKKDRVYEIAEFETGHHLEADFQEFREYKILRWFTKGWRKTFQYENEPDTIYIAALMMGEMHIEQEGDETVFKPPFVWKLTRKGDQVELSRGYKMSKESLVNLNSTSKAIANLTGRVKGGKPEWMKGKWVWEIESEEKEKSE